MENSKKNTNNPPNNNLDKYYKGSLEKIRYLHGKIKIIQEKMDQTSLPIKITNFIILFILLYIFIFIYFNIFISIIIVIIICIITSFYTKTLAFIFFLFYLIIICSILTQTNNILGIPILQTDINKNNVPYNCLNQSLTISNGNLNKDLYGGYFTYSFWLYVNGGTDPNTSNWNNYRYNEWKSIFYRGNPIDNSGDLSSLIQFPGFWLTPVLNNMVIVFQNGSYVERLEINNIPFNTWTNFSVVVETKSVSIYINGNLDRTLNLYQSITIMNSYDLYLTSDILTSRNKQESGFSGFLAELIYYNYALTPNDIVKSYNYYKKIINKYQNKIDSNNNYIIPSLITNSN
jgi:hypothetical protein